MLWMMDQVKEAAGIHMSTFKKAKGDSAPERTTTIKVDSDGHKVEDDEGDEEHDDMQSSGWTPPPHMMAQWAKAV